MKRNAEKQFIGPLVRIQKCCKKKESHQNLATAESYLRNTPYYIIQEW